MLLEEGVCYDQCVLLTELNTALLTGQQTLLETGFHWSFSAQALGPHCKLLLINLSG